MKITQQNQFGNHPSSIRYLAHAYRSTTFKLAFFASQNLIIPSHSCFLPLKDFPFPLYILHRVESQTRIRAIRFIFLSDFWQAHMQKFVFPLCFGYWILRLFEWKGFSQC